MRWLQLVRPLVLALAMGTLSARVAAAQVPVTNDPPADGNPTVEEAVPDEAEATAACSCAELWWARTKNQQNADGIHLTSVEEDQYKAIALRCDPQQRVLRGQNPMPDRCAGEVSGPRPCPVVGNCTERELSAAVQPLPIEYFRFQLENDFFTQSGDSFYTNGLKIETRFDAGLWLQKHRLHPRVANVQWSVSAGQLMYTPVNLREINPGTLRQDRPYAGWLFGGVGLNYHVQGAPFLSSGASRVALELQMGPVGPKSRAAEIQKNWHELLRDLEGCDPADTDCGSPEPLGWRLHYIKGTFGVNLRPVVEAETGGDLRIAAMEAWSGSNLGVRFGGGGFCDIGNVFVQCGLQARVRFGIIGRTIQSIGPTGPIQMGPTLPRSGEARRRPGDPTEQVLPPRPAPPVANEPAVFAKVPWPFELYGFAGVLGRGVAYNALLDRDVCVDTLVAGLDEVVSTCRAGVVEKENFVGDLEFGVILRLRIIEIAYAHVFRSREIAPPAMSADTHKYGVLRVTFLYR